MSAILLLVAREALLAIALSVAYDALFMAAVGGITAWARPKVVRSLKWYPLMLLIVFLANSLFGK